MGETVDLTPAAGAQRRPWRPGVAIWLSVALHIGAVVALIAQPHWWPRLLAVVVLNHVALGLIGLWPKSRLLGANMLRLPQAAAERGEIALTFDDGPDPAVTPKVLDILDAHHARASFFVVGDKAAAHPGLIREIVRRGHSVENHSCAHSNVFGFFAWTALNRDIGRAQDIIAGIIGQRPAFFRSPMGIRNPLLDPVIARLGLRYVTWTRRGFDTVAREPGIVLERLVRNLSAGDILLLHDRSSRGRAPHVLAVLPALLEEIQRAGLKPVSLPMAMR